MGAYVGHTPMRKLFVLLLMSVLCPATDGAQWPGSAIPVRAAALSTPRVYLPLVVGPTRNPATSDPVIAGAGDIACAPSDPYYLNGLGAPNYCRQKYTSDLLLTIQPDVVFTLGDNQYGQGELKNYNIAYAASWGRLKAITYPVPGNHDYLTAGATGYYTYFGAAAGDPTQGYYSYDLGAWHLIALNSNCSAVGGCGAGSPQ